MFRRRSEVRAAAPDVAAAGDRRVHDRPVHDRPVHGLPPGDLDRLAARFGLTPPGTAARTAAAAAPAVALQQAAPLWAAPRPGAAQYGVTAVCGGRVPAALVGVQLWPVLTRAGALVLVDAVNRVHVVVDVARTRGARPGWVAAGTVVHAARTPGSHALWRHWQPELGAHAPHPWSSDCEVHAHLSRPNAQGLLLTAVPQHDAWVMSRSWLPAELVVPSAPDVRWIALGASDRPLAEREPAIRSRWETVSYDEIAAVLDAHHTAERLLPPTIAAVVRSMLPAQDRDAVA